MATETNTETFRLTSTPDSVNKVASLIDRLRDVLNIREDVYGNMLVAITEAVSNAIYHGNRGDSSKQIKLDYSLSDDQVCFTVADEGYGFDYYNIPDPTDPDMIDKPNGRGIFLMKHLSDQLIFSEDGRIVELYFKLN